QRRTHGRPAPRGGRRRRRRRRRSDRRLRPARPRRPRPGPRRPAQGRQPPRTRNDRPRGDPVRVALADDAAVLREGLARVLAAAAIGVAAQVGTPDDLLAAVEELRPDAAVVDIRMPPTWTDEGLAVAGEIRRRFADVGVLLLSQYVEAGYALKLLDGD